MNYLSDLAVRTLRTFWQVAKIMLPVMILVRVADTIGFSKLIAAFLSPLMTLIGLPGEAGIVWAIALLVGLYGGIGALVAMAATLDINVAQFNALIAMMLFAHGLPLEQAIVKRAGGSLIWTTGARLFCAIAFAALVMFASNFTGWWTQPAHMGVIANSALSDDWFSWSLNSARTLAFMAAILFALLALIDGMKRIGLFDKITHAMTPSFSRLGITPALAPLTTIGMLLGITYGSGLIIEETSRNEFSARDLLIPLVGLSILHAVIEDTVIMLAFGADFWIAIVGRTLFGLGFLAVLAWFINKQGIKAVAQGR